MSMEKLPSGNKGVKREAIVILARIFLNFFQLCDEFLNQFNFYLTSQISQDLYSH